MALSGTDALKFEETIAINGNGDLYTRTDIPYANDRAQGIGAQNYSLAFDFQSAFSGSFRSKYALKGEKDSTSDLRPTNIIRDNSENKLDALPVTQDNRYLVGFVDNSLQYTASINQIGDIYSDNSIELLRNGYGSHQIVTNYDIGGQGILKQKIVEKGYNFHPMTLSEANVKGDFSLTSKMENYIQTSLSDIDYSTPEYLGSKLPPQPPAGNIGENRFAVYLGRLMPPGSNSLEVVGSKNLRGIVLNRPAGCMVP